MLMSIRFLLYFIKSRKGHCNYAIIIRIIYQLLSFDLRCWYGQYFSYLLAMRPSVVTGRLVVKTDPDPLWIPMTDPDPVPLWIPFADLPSEVLLMLLLGDEYPPLENSQDILTRPLVDISSNTNINSLNYELL